MFVIDMEKDLDQVYHHKLLFKPSKNNIKCVYTM